MKIIVVRSDQKSHNTSWIATMKPPWFTIFKAAIYNSFALHLRLLSSGTGHPQAAEAAGKRGRAAVFVDNHEKSQMT